MCARSGESAWLVTDGDASAARDRPGLHVGPAEVVVPMGGSRARKARPGPGPGAVMLLCWPRPWELLPTLHRMPCAWIRVCKVVDPRRRVRFALSLFHRLRPFQFPLGRRLLVRSDLRASESQAAKWQPCPFLRTDHDDGKEPDDDTAPRLGHDVHSPSHVIGST
eukprot:2465762-Rhodomonas_salina.1